MSVLIAYIDMYINFRNSSQDTGVNVRKRLLKYFKDIFSLASTIEMQVDVLKKVVGRLADTEPTVKVSLI